VRSRQTKPLFDKSLREAIKFTPNQRNRKHWQMKKNRQETLKNDIHLINLALVDEKYKEQLAILSQCGWGEKRA
jgi:hypothetical protein